MKETKAEGTTFIFVDKSSIDEGVEYARTCYPKFDVERARDILRSDGIRLALFRSLLPPNNYRPYYLAWGEGAEITDIDSKVELGIFKDEDFSSSIKTHFQVTKCFTCGERFNTLAVDAGDPYPGAPRLLQTKIQRFKFKSCPNCGASLRQLVAKILK